MNQAYPRAFAEATRLWSKIGWLGFGGPAGQIALMHGLVDEQRWIDEDAFLHALNYLHAAAGSRGAAARHLCRLAAAWRARRLVAGIAVRAAGLLVMLATEHLLRDLRAAAVLEALFFGVKARGLAVVVEAVVRIGRRALRTGMGAVAAPPSWRSMPSYSFPLIILAAGLTGWVVARRVGRVDLMVERGEQARCTRPTKGHAP